jgi:gas vesicle protein
MKAMACAAAAMMFAFTTGCKDRDREDTASRIDNAAEEAGQEVREGAEKVGHAAEDAADNLDAYSYERRDEFRRDVRKRLDRMDSELAEFEQDAKGGADRAHQDAVAAARDARQAVDRDLERLGDATAANWDELRHRVSEALDSADRELRALRSDAKPMGGTGGPG